MNAPIELTPAQSRRALLRRRDQEKEVTRAVKEVAPNLFAGTAGAGLTEDQLKVILSVLSHDKGTHQLRRVRRILRTLLYQLEKTSGGQVAKPAMELTLRRRASPFAGSAIGRIRTLNVLLDSFLESISRNRVEDPAVQAGQILLSAVVLGGLLARQLVVGLPLALKSGLGAHGSMFWVEFNPDDGHVRRWFPDPVTSSLIARWHRAGQAWPNNRTPLQLIQDQMKRLADGREAPFRNFSELRAAAQARLRLTVPGLLVDHLLSVRQGQSLPTRAWWRLLADYQLAEEPPQPGEELDAEPPSTPASSATRSEVVGQDPVAILMRFMKELRGHDGRLISSHAKALQRLTAFRDNVPDMDPMLRELMSWAIWLLEPGKTPRLRPSSAHRYLSSIAAKLLNIAGEIDPTQATGVELELIYESVLQSTHSAQARGMAVSCLRSFHVFLILAHGVEQADIDGQTTGHVTVRANVISSIEYRMCRLSLQNAGQRQLELMLVLLYRLGLRRSELRFIRLSDFQFDKEGVRPLLWIHSHPDRRLKSTSSTRRMPLQQLLTVPERGLLHEHYKQRLLECGKDAPANALLFSVQGNDTAPLPDSELDILVETLRHVCKDSSLVLHSLRHTFVTNLFGDILRAGLPDLDQEDCMPWRTDLPYENPLTALFRRAHLPREAAYTIAVLAGHLGPAESLHSYIHLHDYIAYFHLRTDAARHPADFWARLEGVRTDTLHVRASRQRTRGEEIPPHLDTPARLLKRCRIGRPKGKFADRAHAPESSPDEALPVRQTTPLEHVYRSISRSTVFMSASARELVTSYSKPFQELLVANARALASLRTSAPRTVSRRSRLLGKVQPRRRPAITRRPQLDGLGPALPRSIESLREAQLAFRRATTDEKGVIKPIHILELLHRSSHSKPWVRIYRVRHVVHLVRLLSALGVPYARMRLLVVSLPKDCDAPARWLKDVKDQIAIRECVVELATPAHAMPRSPTLNPEGVLHLEVSGKTRRSTGWRVGCYYAACFMATCNGIELMEFLKLPRFADPRQ